MKTAGEMIRINRRQAEFYDSVQDAELDTGQHGYAENKSANFLTRTWAGLRNRHRAAVKQAGIDALLDTTQERWAVEKTGGDFLEIGCFSGSRMTFRLAAIAGNYLGVDLSPKAVEVLNGKFEKRGLAGKARAVAVDFLAMDESRKFDLFFAHGVLHHFENPAPIFEKLVTLSKPNAFLLFTEPSLLHPFYGFVRKLYRPFQSDAAWEWPFTRHTIETVERHFIFEEGFGWGSRSLPLSVLSATPLAGWIFKRWYLHAIHSEVNKGWHPKVWHNSSVTVKCRLRRKQN
jgi:SAM-dependent methyltransferase